MKVDNMNQLKRSDNTRIRKIELSYYLIKSGECYEINEIGALVVNAIGKVCERLSKMYNYENLKVIECDVRKFIDYLIENKIVDLLVKEN